MVEATFLYTNANALMPKMDELRSIASRDQPTIILICETWLHEQITDALITIDNYRVFRLDRQDKKGGGICIYIRNKLKNLNIHASILEHKVVTPTESLWLNINIETIRFVIACIYRPKYTTEHENKSLISNLQTALNKELPCYVFGDFNYPEIDWSSLCLASNSLQARDFLNGYKEMNATQLTTFPTRYRNTQGSLLDLLLVNDNKLVHNITKNPPLGKSDHIVITATTQFPLREKPTHRITKRNFWLQDYTEANNFISENFQRRANNTVLDCYDIINKCIEYHIPLKQVKTNPWKPWLNHLIFKVIKKKRRLWDNYVANKTVANYDKYKVENNKVRHLITEARRKYENDIASANNKTFYTYVKRSLNSKVTSIALKDASGNIVDNPYHICEMFAQQFNKVFTLERDNAIPTLPNYQRTQNSIDTINFTPEGVLEAINSLKNYASPGTDGIPPVFLKGCSRALCTPLAAAMSDALTTGFVHDMWNHATVTPIYKKGDRYLAENFRPISLTSALSKCMEKIIVKQLTTFLLENGVIPVSQHGFLPRRSIDTNLLSCLNDWTMHHDNGEPVDTIYLDFEKAFDKVPFKRLLYKLEHFGVRGALLRWITNFLTRRKFQVRVAGSMSDERPVNSGVPQGSVLGPLLFLLYISDMANDIQSNISFFADDTKLYHNPQSSARILQGDLLQIEQWTDKWLMSLNANKCTVLHIGPSNPGATYFIGGNPLVAVDQQEDLGVIISKDLKWERHIAKVVKRANSLIFLIQKAFKDHSAATILRLYRSYIRPTLEFAVSSWNPYYAKDIDLLERVQRRITKIPPELKNLPYEERCRKLSLSTLRERRQRGDLITTHKILAGYYNVPLHIFQRSEQNFLRGHNQKLSKERCSKLCRRNFLGNRIVYVWNSLNQDTIDAPSTNSFKNRLDKDLKNINRELVHY